MNRSLLNQQYKPLRKIATGSMGEIFLARQVGVAGFRREVVLKRIHRRLNDNPKAVRMFLDEARLAASLNHPNIVQIFDIYEEDGSYFIVMERIRGSNLRDLAETTTRQGKMIPMELSVNIITQVLEGLRYAHQFHDETGRALKIVHRDICPTNILVSFDGAVKLVDFGIARAEEQLLQESGPSGKFAYMSPEVIRGEQADARSDLVSVGILLYELTVGQRLFRAPSLEAMRRIMNDPIPPPTFSRAGYPVDLEIIVMRALERDPADRFPSAEEMLEELERFAFDTGMRISRLRLGRFVREILGVTTRDALRVPEPEAIEETQEGTAQEDLDFDHNLFEEPMPSGRDLPPDEDLKQSERSSRVMEAIQQANEAIAELVVDDEDDEGETIEIPPSNQAMLRADTVPPAQEPTGRAQEPTGPREGSALIVTDDMIELEEEPSSVVTVVTPTEDSQKTKPRAEAPAEMDDEEDLDLDLDMRVRAAGVQEEAVEPPEPSADLKDALAEISEELKALELSDMEREAAIGKLIRGTEQPTEQPSELVGSLLGRSAPAEAAPEVEGDELERVDHPARRALDDLELSDLDELKLEPEEETTNLDAAIELAVDDLELVDDDEIDGPTIPDLPAPVTTAAPEAPSFPLKKVATHADVSPARRPRLRSRSRSRPRPKHKKRHRRSRASTRRSSRPSPSSKRRRRR